MDIPLKQIRNLLKTLEEGGASEFEYEDEKVRLRIAMASGAPVVVAAPSAGHVATVPVSASGSPTAVREEAKDPNVVFVTSPFVGTFYQSPAPDADPFVQVGATVKKGQTLCIVEAMKLMNEIEAEFPGTIQEVLVQNGQSVEFGQKLFKLKKA